MYSITKFEDRQMFACSVPPPYNENLEEGFQELSRIHFYMGQAPIDFMIETVERASLTDIEKGKIQIYFACKEIQDFFSSSWGNVSAFGEGSLNPALYFDKTFKNILEHTEKIVNGAYKKPAGKENLVKIETMLGLTHEVIFLSQNLKEVGIETSNNDDLVNSIKEKYQKIFDLKSHYEQLKELKPFAEYEESAKQSVLAQLTESYNFNYTDLTKIYAKDDSWVYDLQNILEQQKDIDTNPDYPFNPNSAKELKENFLKQIKSFNRLLKNGVVNYALSFAASISREAYHNVRNSQVSAQSYFDRELNYHKKGLEHWSGRDYHKDKIKELESIKEEYIQKKIDDKTFYEEYLTILYRQEQSITRSLNKVKAKIFNIELKETLTLEGDIKNGFVVGKFSNNDNVMLIHKDNTVNVPEAIYAMIYPKIEYDKLVANDKLVFNEALKEAKFDTASNFWSYGQLLQELVCPKIQNFFLGQEFDLVDKTSLKETKKKKMVY